MVRHFLLEPKHTDYAIVYARAATASPLHAGEEAELIDIVVDGHGAQATPGGVWATRLKKGRTVFYQLIRSPRIAFEEALN